MLARALFFAVALSVAGCRRDPSPGDRTEVEAGSVDTGGDSAAYDAGGRVARAIEERAEALADGGTISSACAGASLGLIEAALDERCAIAELEWARLSAAPVKGLRQEAKADGDVVVFALVNGGAKPVDVPLRLRAGSLDLAFTVLAEVAEVAEVRRVVVELASPRIAGAIAAPKRAAGASDGGHIVQSARVRLPPGGAARARLIIDPKIGASVVGDGGGIATLPKGRVELHIGQMLTALEAGPPAHLAWEIR